MKVGEVIYTMYNGVNSGTPDTLLFSGIEQGKNNWSCRNHFKTELPLYIQMWINKEQFITSSFLVGFLEEFAKNKTHRQLFNSVEIRITPSIPEPQDRKYIAELKSIVDSELRRALVRIATTQAGENNE